MRMLFFPYISSTAYVAGTGVTYCKETLSSVKTFTNVYEESKAEAEKIISRFCEKNSICPFNNKNIYRYGEIQIRGRSLKF